MGLAAGGSSFQGTWSSGDLYGFLGGDFAAANGSNNIRNYTGLLTPNGITTTGLVGFDVYIIEAETAFDAKSLLEVSGDILALGTFGVAFSEDDKEHVYSTAFTNAGLVNRGGGGGGGGQNEVPEPASLILLGTAL